MRAAAGHEETHGALAVSFSKVSFAYRDAPVISQADFSLPCGGLGVLEGGNGTGKSTFARLLLGELAPKEGSVKLFGREVSRFSRWSELGYVPQQTPADYDRFPATVLEVVRAGLYADAGPLLPYRPRHRARALEALASVGLQGLERRLVGELSGGQFQRVLLARALVAGPRLLVLDEPTSNLDDKSTESFYRVVDQARRTSGAAVLLITHDRGRMPDLGGSFWTLERGRLTQEHGGPAPANACARSRGQGPDVARTCGFPGARPESASDGRPEETSGDRAERTG